jgi:hypothetical protein
MPISSIASYVGTADEVIPHWTDVNVDRLAKLKVAGGYDLPGFTVDRDALQAALTGIIGLENSRELAADDRDAQKKNLRTRLDQFRSALRLHLAKTAYYRVIPKMPHESSAESKFMSPFDDMADLWGRIDADAGIAGFTPPLLLTGGYTLAGFIADIATMRAYFRAVDDAENDLEIARKQRDMMLDPLKERMQQYRAAIELEYGPGHPFYQSLPSLTPAPGSTPDGVIASGIWDDITAEAQITWQPSTNPNLDQYSIRMTPGATYDTENNTVLATVAASEVKYRTMEGLLNSGDTASYWAGRNSGICGNCGK